MLSEPVQAGWLEASKPFTQASKCPPGEISSRLGLKRLLVGGDGDAAGVRTSFLAGGERPVFEV